MGTEAGRRRRVPDAFVTLVLIPVVISEALWRHRKRVLAAAVVAAFVLVIVFPPRGIGR